MTRSNATVQPCSSLYHLRGTSPQVFTFCVCSCACPPEVVERRTHAAPMGGCCSAAQSDGVKLVGYAASGKAGDVSGEGPKRHILRCGGIDDRPVVSHAQLTAMLLAKHVCIMPKSFRSPRPFPSALHTASSSDWSISHLSVRPSVLSG